MKDTDDCIWWQLTKKGIFVSPRSRIVVDSGNKAIASKKVSCSPRWIIEFQIDIGSNPHNLWLVKQDPVNRLNINYWSVRVRHWQPMDRHLFVIKLASLFWRQVTEFVVAKSSKSYCSWPKVLTKYIFILSQESAKHQRFSQIQIIPRESLHLEFHTFDSVFRHS